MSRARPVDDLFEPQFTFAEICRATDVDGMWLQNLLRRDDIPLMGKPLELLNKVKGQGRAKYCLATAIQIRTMNDLVRFGVKPRNAAMCALAFSHSRDGEPDAAAADSEAEVGVSYRDAGTLYHDALDTVLVLSVAPSLSGANIEYDSTVYRFNHDTTALSLVQDSKESVFAFVRMAEIVRTTRYRLGLDPNPIRKPSPRLAQSI